MSKLSLHFLTFTFFIYFSVAQISDKRLCVDPECNSPVALAKTLRRYHSPDKYRLSFGPNEDVVIFSKSAGSDVNLWGAEINGKRGYVPKNLVRETRKIKQPNLLIDTEITNGSKDPEVPSKEEIVNPTKVKQNFEVIDGTTIYTTEESTTMEENQKYTTEIPTQSIDSVRIDNIPINNKEQILTFTENTNSENSDLKNSVRDVSEIEDTVEEEKTIIKTSASTENSSEAQSFLMTLNNKTEDLDASKAEDIIDEGISGDHAKDSEVEVTDIEENAIHSNTHPLTELKNQVRDLGSNGSVIDIIETKEEMAFDENANSELNDNSNDESAGIKASIANESILKESTSTLQLNFDVIEESHKEIDNKPDNIELDNLLNVSNSAEGKFEIQKDVSNILDGSDLLINEDNLKTNTHDSPQSSGLDSIQSSGSEMKDENPVQDNIQNVHSISENLSLEINSNTSEKTSQSVDIESISISDQSSINPENKLIDHPQIISDISLEVEEEGKAIVHENNQTEQLNELNNADDIEQNSDIFNDENNQKETSNVYTTYNELQIQTDTNLPIKNDDIINSNIQNNIAEDHYHIQNDQRSGSQEGDDEKKNDMEEKTNQETPTIFSSLLHNVDETYSERKKSDVASNIGNMVDRNIDEEFKDQENTLNGDDFCIKQDCPSQMDSRSSEDFFSSTMDALNFGSDIFLYLITTAASVVIFLLGHFALDKSRREGPLIAKINKLEKELLILLKEKEILAEQVENRKYQDQSDESDVFLKSKEENRALEEKVQLLEEQVQTLEKELENSTEVGLELNRMLSEVLNSENAGQTLMLNIEELQTQLAEQQNIVSNMKEVLSLKETENHELNLELDIANNKVLDLQNELDKLLLNIIKLEEAKESLEKNAESSKIQLKETINSLTNQLDDNRKEYTENIEELNSKLSTLEHNLQLKTKEYEGLKNSMQQIKDMKNANTLESLLEVNSIKAELEQLKSECQGHCDKLRREKESNAILKKEVMSAEEDIDILKNKFNETDKTKLELETKLQVLTNYFKEREEQLQMELTKYENMWSAKKGEATSTSERIKYLQSEVQNYKSQNETLKQEIVSQEVELKGQISVLEKKVHENWVSARQAERRLEELKQEAAQLRNRLTLRERALQEDRLHNRMQSPLEQGGDLPVSPLHLESPASPPLLYNSRDHITKSPPILGMPPPFLPPPSGSSYLPPPPLPFMPPPPHDMFPGDHRPPPLGRMSSPPLNSSYSPTRPYSPYDRSPSPSYDESEYGTSPVHRRNYSQFNRRRDHRPAAIEKFNGRSGTLSSGSDNSNEFIDQINHQNSKV